MAKNFLYRWFGLGRIPRSMRHVLEGEGIILAEEGLSGTITRENFRAPGYRCSWEKRWLIGSLVLTPKRFVAYAGSHTVIEIPMPNRLGPKLGVALEKKDRIRFVFDPANFQQNASGTITLRYRTPEAQKLYEWLAASTAI